MKSIWQKFYSPSICKEKRIPWRSFIKFAKLLKKPNLRKVIDVGCGYGAESIYLAERGFEVTGIDINKEAINFAKNRAKRFNLKAKFICSDVSSYLKKPPNKSVDIYSTLSYEIQAYPIYLFL